MNKSLQNKEIREDGKIIDINEVGTYNDDLGFAVSVILDPLKQYVQTLIMNEEDPRITIVLEALIENTDRNLSELLCDVKDCVGPIILNRVPYNHGYSLPAKTIVSIELDSID